MTQLNVWLQTIGGPVLDQLFLLLTNLAHPLTISLAAILIYWCYNKQYGISAALAVTTSAGLNTAIKLILDIPRPYTYDLRIQPLDTLTAPGSSFPSNHAQSIAAFLTAVCLSFRRTWVVVLSAILCLVVAFSRLYLGVHTIVDVLAGLTVGFFGAWLVFWLTQKLIVGKKRLLLVFPAAMLILTIIFRQEDLCKMGGISLGFVTGYLLDERTVHRLFPQSIYPCQTCRCCAGPDGCRRRKTVYHAGISQYHAVYLFGISAHRPGNQLCVPLLFPTHQPKTIPAEINGFLMPAIKKSTHRMVTLFYKISKYIQYNPNNYVLHSTASSISFRGLAAGNSFG